MAGQRQVAPVPADVLRVSERFESWRKNKSGRERIPEPLWAAALKLCARHGVERVRRSLRVNYTALRDRLMAAGAGNTRRERRRAREKENTAPAFVELVSSAPTPGSAGAEYVLELDGVTLRVRNAAVADVAALAKLVRGEASRP